MRNGNVRFWNAAGTLAGSRSKPASVLNQRSIVGVSSLMLDADAAAVVSQIQAPRSENARARRWKRGIAASESTRR
jgi:hypothetical protein